MKQVYFTSENINQKSKHLLEAIQQKSYRFDINKAALLVLDMQNFFLDENSHAFIPSAKPIISNIKKLIEFFNSNNQPVIYTKHINNEENAAMMGFWWRDLIKNDAIIDEFKPQLIIEKSQYDAFYDTDLENILKKQDVEQIVITGVMTHLCCETTTRSAFVRGFVPYFIADCTATYNEEFHKASVLNLSHGFANCCLSGEIINA